MDKHPVILTLTVYKFMTNISLGWKFKALTSLIIYAGRNSTCKYLGIDMYIRLADRYLGLDWYQI